mmetsp:Transcript_9158/g.27531  ORF Transcript_9158/g.27531 Transcript_9158/m.27531 type:complete len:201 (+) Transcript_9158:861-1463(+)
MTMDSISDTESIVLNPSNILSASSDDSGASGVRRLISSRRSRTSDSSSRRRRAFSSATSARPSNSSAFSVSSNLSMALRAFLLARTALEKALTTFPVPLRSCLAASKVATVVAVVRRTKGMATLSIMRFTLGAAADTARPAASSISLENESARRDRSYLFRSRGSDSAFHAWATSSKSGRSARAAAASAGSRPMRASGWV